MRDVLATMRELVEQQEKANELALAKLLIDNSPDCLECDGYGVQEHQVLNGRYGFITPTVSKSYCPTCGGNGKILDNTPLPSWIRVELNNLRPNIGEDETYVPPTVVVDELAEHGTANPE